MRRHVVDLLAVDPDVAPVAEAVEILLAVIGRTSCAMVYLRSVVCRTLLRDIRRARPRHRGARYNDPVAIGPCSHLDTVRVHEASRAAPRLRGLPEDRRPVGAPADVPGVRQGRLLRQLAEQARDRALPRDRAPADPLGRAGRGLARGATSTRCSSADGARDDWPELPYEAWRDTRDTLHMYLQIIGKVRLALAPMEPQWGQVPLYVTARGLHTSPIPHPERRVRHRRRPHRPRGVRADGRRARSNA